VERPSFKAQLLADPPAALAALGITVPPGMKVKVLEDTDSLTHFVLRAPPAASCRPRIYERLSAGYRLSRSAIASGTATEAVQIKKGERDDDVEERSREALAGPEETGRVRRRSTRAKQSLAMMS
jgi:hypothetical protein